MILQKRSFFNGKEERIAIETLSDEVSWPTMLKYALTISIEQGIRIDDLFLSGQSVTDSIREMLDRASGMWPYKKK